MLECMEAHPGWTGCCRPAVAEGQVGLDVQDRGAVHKVCSTHHQAVAIYALNLGHTEPYNAAPRITTMEEGPAD